MSKAKTIKVDDPVKSLIDRGFEINNQIKNLSYEDKAIKAKLQENLVNETNDVFSENDSNSIAIEGNNGKAKIVKNHKIEIKGSDEEMDDAVKAVNSSEDLKNVASVVEHLDVPEHQHAKAYEVLKQAGFDVNLKSSINVDRVKYDNLKQSSAMTNEEQENRQALDNVVNEKTYYKVTFSK